MSEFPNNPLMTETEAARLLGLKVGTLRRWRWAGKPPVYRKIGGAVRNGGLFNVDPTVTISGALAMAGGPTPDGKTDEVLLIRDDEIITTILGGTTLIAESPVRSGDQLFVPMRSWISRNASLLATFAGLALAFVVAVDSN